MARELRGANAAAFSCTDSEVLLEGRAGTGKSIGWLTKAHVTARMYPNSRQLILRAYRANLTESVIPTFEDKVLGPTHPMVTGHSRKNRHSYRYPNGSEIVLAGLDMPGKTFSTEWDRVYINEATEITQDAFELLFRSLRNFKTPYHQIIADCNPGAPGHWLNQRATPAGDKLRDVQDRGSYERLQKFNHGKQREGMRRLIGCHQDNPFYFDLTKWDFTKQGKEFLANLAKMSGHNLQRMLKGRWVAADGVVYPEFDETRHIITPFKVPSDWPMYVGIDPGYDHPCAILWFAIGYDNTYYIIDELYRGGLAVKQHAEDIKKKNPGRTIRGYYGDPQMSFSSTMYANDGETISEQFSKHGISMFPWPRTGNNAQPMVEAVRERLNLDTLKVFRNCANTIREFQSWSFKRTSDGQVPKGDDAYEDKDNDAMDVVKGLVAMNFKFAHDKIEAHGSDE